MTLQRTMWYKITLNDTKRQVNKICLFNKTKKALSEWTQKKKENVDSFISRAGKRQVNKRCLFNKTKKGIAWLNIKERKHGFF